ncbi:MAG: AraC family transcriptional regulator [Bacteroidales bacterium]|nr:AraC family transcriptional regulator [Bacteroidales bacterium]
MSIQQIKKFSVIGISVRTTNENGQAGNDITALWNKFMSEDILEKIPNKIDNSIYCVYTDYEKDHTKPYTVILGCKVINPDNIPVGMVGKSIEGGKYEKYVAKGNILQGIVFDAWNKIWGLDIPRTYIADFEVYSETIKNLEDAEVDIFIDIK